MVFSTEACYEEAEVASGDVQEVDTSMISFGIILGCVGSVGINTGNNLQAVGLKALDAKGASLGLASGSQELQPKNSLTWIVGTIIFFSATIVNFVAFAFAPAAVLAPLESIQFVCNVVFNRFVNKSDVTPMMYAGSLCVVGGTLIAIVWGPRNVYSFDLAHLKCFWAAPGWLVYLAIVIIIALTAERTNRTYQRAYIAGESFANDAWVRPCAYATSSALLGTQSVVQAKVISELFELLTAKSQTHILGDWFIWVTIILFAVTGAVWLYRLNNALKLYEPLFIIPLLQANYIMCAVVSGGIYFQEFLQMRAHQWVLFVTGIATMFYGLYLLFPRQPRDGFPMEAAVSVTQMPL